MDAPLAERADDGADVTDPVALGETEQLAIGEGLDPDLEVAAPPARAVIGHEVAQRDRPAVIGEEARRQDLRELGVELGEQRAAVASAEIGDGGLHRAEPEAALGQRAEEVDRALLVADEVVVADVDAVRVVRDVVSEELGEARLVPAEQREDALGAARLVAMTADDRAEAAVMQAAARGGDLDAPLDVTRLEVGEIELDPVEILDLDHLGGVAGDELRARAIDGQDPVERHQGLDLGLRERDVDVAGPHDPRQRGDEVLPRASAHEADARQVGGDVLGRPAGHHAADGDVGPRAELAQGLDERDDALEVALEEGDPDEVDLARGEDLAQRVHAEDRTLSAGDRHLHVREHDLGGAARERAEHVEHAARDLAIVVGHVAVHQRLEEERRVGHGLDRGSGDCGAPTATRREQVAQQRLGGVRRRLLVQSDAVEVHDLSRGFPGHVHPRNRPGRAEPQLERAIAAVAERLERVPGRRRRAQQGRDRQTLAALVDDAEPRRVRDVSTAKGRLPGRRPLGGLEPEPMRRSAAPQDLQALRHSLLQRLIG